MGLIWLAVFHTLWPARKLYISSLEIVLKFQKYSKYLSFCNFSQTYHVGVRENLRGFSVRNVRAPVDSMICVWKYIKNCLNIRFLKIFQLLLWFFELQKYLIPFDMIFLLCFSCAHKWSRDKCAVKRPRRKRWSSWFCFHFLTKWRFRSYKNSITLRILEKCVKRSMVSAHITIHVTCGLP